MPQATHTGSGRLMGSRLPLGAYRRVSREPATQLKKLAGTDKKRVSAVWETVSSWEGSEGTSCNSSASGVSGASPDVLGACYRHLQLRMEGIRRINLLHQGPPPLVAAGAAAAKNGETGTSVGNVLSGQASVSLVDAERDGEDILLSSHVAVTTPSRMLQGLQAVGTRPRERRCRVQRLAPAEWSELLQLGDNEAIEL
ncbi:hypothetical protein TraAM80_05917 [Trypanosoma rangeli]|uniref:Uncharacterized protein n=1 Tax=Trypanosoma rangeli TaxID=5698 RepID=A0A422NCI6_TRYRA|nr:uncharacterized protein TraAM80_05917 [Trypanosoma rangeli]RNF03183.1 hypothetical protein TraAM80_05917 [Trypanosoma rangeli]|eukprot:RNF03183.1 hypothetical protein TraAM80_05917 [Trypanosoma rangeli]